LSIENPTVGWCIVLASDEMETVLAEAAFIEVTGIEELDGLLRLWVADERDAGELGVRLSRWHPTIERVESRNWNETWQREWKAVEVGERFYLVPPGDTSATPAGRVRLEMHAGIAFGNGDHPTTQLCLAEMERGLRTGDSFLDVGCGSGLLGQAARALGAGRVWGCDLDPAAVRSGAFIGSVDAVRSASCDYIVANIRLGVLVAILPEIVRVMRPGSRGLLSGVLPEQLGDLRAAAASAGLICGTERIADGWALLKVKID
jgi:ribosomal protein L11 methyltransferase